MNIFDRLTAEVITIPERDEYLADSQLIYIIEYEYPLLYEVVDESDLGHALECLFNLGIPISGDTLSQNFMKQCIKLYPECLI